MFNPKNIIDMNFEIDNENIEKSFNRIATDLMNNWILSAGNKSYQICELEFYYENDSHKDPYTHKHDLQTKMGKWYFHGSGLDITFGSENNPRSILIRAIYDLDNSNYIYGPLKSVTELLGNLPGIYGGYFSLRLEQDTMGKIKNEDKKLFEAPRVGLNKEKDSNGDFFENKYRFFVMPRKEHKDKETMFKNSGLTVTEINEILGYKMKNL
jgi:3-methyladenine DNA glycosylase Mpg